MINGPNVKYDYDGANPRLNDVNDLTWAPKLTIENKPLNENGIQVTGVTSAGIKKTLILNIGVCGMETIVASTTETQKYIMRDAQIYGDDVIFA